MHDELTIRVRRIEMSSARVSTGPTSLLSDLQKPHPSRKRSNSIYPSPAPSTHGRPMNRRSTVNSRRHKKSAVVQEFIETKTDHIRVGVARLWLGYVPRRRTGLDDRGGLCWLLGGFDPQCWMDESAGGNLQGVELGYGGTSTIAGLTSVNSRLFPLG